ncbi:MAG: metal/formaldehyde-sensitive transcriptional repressor [Candidatus Melainabacteria bacterium]|nr:metal/formaldehyde-sensitive transcriptional repressor [Candidatus Melainabacteria bacterium]
MHTRKDKKKLLARVSRIRGQVDAIYRALELEEECGQVLNTIAACRGAMNGLMNEVLAGHIQTHLAEPQDEGLRKEAADELVAVLKSYLK